MKSRLNRRILLLIPLKFIADCSNPKIQRKQHHSPLPSKLAHVALSRMVPGLSEVIPRVNENWRSKRNQIWRKPGGVNPFGGPNTGTGRSCVCIEKTAGSGSGFPDADYTQAGASNVAIQGCRRLKLSPAGKALLQEYRQSNQSGR